MFAKSHFPLGAMTQKLIMKPASKEFICKAGASKLRRALSASTLDPPRQTRSSTARCNLDRASP